MMRKIIAKQKLKEYMNKLRNLINDNVISIKFSLSIEETKKVTDEK